MEWQPIETAPRDGTAVLLYDTEGVEGPSYVMAFWLDAPQWSGWAYDDDLLRDAIPLGPANPTHWLPILPPEAPQ